LHRRNLLVLIVAAYPAWLAFEAVHEAGHVLHAWLSGGHVVLVDLPLLGFSRTDVSPNPYPLFVAAGGVAWGSLIPLVIWAVHPRHWSTSSRVCQFYAGLCAIGNGAYLAIGWIDRTGDAGDLMKHGAPVVVIAGAGTLLLATGLWMWHDLGRRPKHAR
jgi:hypothetical protein